MSETALRAALVAAVTLATACSVGPQPQPVPGLWVELQVQHISLRAEGIDTVITGGPGAVTQPRGTLSALRLDGSGPPAETAITGDGGFELRLEGAPSDVFRLRAVVDTYFSQPLDVTAEGGADGPAVDVADLDCARGLAPKALDFGGVAVGDESTRTIELAHGCDAPVTVLGLALRLGAPELSVRADLPLIVSAGGTAAVTVSFRPAAQTAVTDVLVLELDRPIGRVAVTLDGQGVEAAAGGDAGGGTTGGAPPPD